MHAHSGAHKEADREVQQATLEQLEVGDVDWRDGKGERGSAKESERCSAAKMADRCGRWIDDENGG